MNEARIRQIILQEMRKIYYKDLSKRIDWMGYIITEDNKPTYHHIVKKEELLRDNKEIGATLENGAYLGKRSHEMLHQIELIDYDLYECWNDLFLMINRMGTYPVEDVWQAIFHLRKLSEEVIQRQNIKNRGK